MNKKISLVIVLMLTLIASTRAQNWSLEHFNDQFGDKTEQSFVCGIQEGTFSNTATLKSKMSVVIQVTKETITLKIFEYNNSLALFSSEFGEILIKDKDQILKIKCYQGQEGYLFFQDKSYYQFLKILEKPDTYKCFYKEVSTGVGASYSFKIDTTGFKKLSNQIQ